MEAVKSPVMLYTEQTPNPETLKFVTNKMLYRGTADFKHCMLSLMSKEYISAIIL